MMDFHIEHVHSVNRDDWDTLIRSSASFYHTYQWVQICSQALRGHGQFFCLYDQDELVAGMPGVVVSRFGLSSFFSMPFGTYGAVIFKANLPNDIPRYFFKQLEKHLSKNRFLQTQIVDYNRTCTSWNTVGFTREKYFTQIIDIGNAAFLPDKKVMAEIKAGEKSGGEITACSPFEYLDDYYRLYEATEKRHGRKAPLYNKEFFLTLEEVLSGTGMLYRNGLLIDNRLIGAQLHFLFGNTLYYWQAVSDSGAREFRTDYRLLYDAIRHAQRLGVRFVNLGASPADAGGLVFFKKRWGGEKREYDILSARSRLHKLLRRA